MRSRSIPRLLLVAAVLAPLTAAQTPPDTFLLVHADPNEYSPLHWTDLQDLVLQAEQRNVKVSLELGTTWVEQILADSAKLQVVEDWLRNGHVVGAHHHDVTHPFWDQYTDLDPAYVATIRPEPVLGTMADFYELQNRLHRVMHGRIPAWPDFCQFGGLDDSISYEFPYSMPYGTDGGRAAAFAVSRPYFRIENRYGAWFVGHAYLGAGEQAKLQTLIQMHTSTWAPDTFGFTLHVSDYANDPTLYTDWFDYLSTRDPAGTYNKTILDILQPYGRVLEASSDILPAAGGSVTLTLQTDASLAGHTVQFLVSLAGSDPGIDRGGPLYDDMVHIGLNPDSWTSWSMSPASSPWLTGFLGTLDAGGRATATMDTLGPLPLSWVGTVITATAVAYDASGITFSANPVAITVQ